MAKLNLPKDVKVLIWVSFFFLIGFIVPITMTLSNQEILNPVIAQRISLFGDLLQVGSIVVLLLYFTRKLWSKDDIYGNGFGFLNIGEKPAFSISKRFTSIQFVWLFLIITSSIFLLINSTGALGRGLTGLQTLPTQQFSPGESLAFSTLLIPASEEMLSLAVTGILVLILVLIAVKSNMTKQTFKTLYFTMIPLSIGIVAVFWHISAYAGQDMNLIYVGIFWFLKTILILATGFFALGWVLHATNNFFIDFTRLYSHDLVLFSMIGVILLLIVGYVLVYKGRLLGDPNRT